MANSSDLQDRFRGHAKAFDGLLSLIPAKLYYGEDVSGQWKKKKRQSKAEAAAARRGKLDPDSELNRNAKEVMDERARKRKLDEMQDEGSDDGVEKESRGEGPKKARSAKPNKKQKKADGGDGGRGGEDGKAEATNGGVPRRKKQQKIEREARRRAKKAERKRAEAEKAQDARESRGQGGKMVGAETPGAADAVEANAEPGNEETCQGETAGDGRRATEADVSDPEAMSDPAPARSSPALEPLPPTSSDDAEPAAAAVASPPSGKPGGESGRHRIEIPPDNAEFRARLAAKLAAMRAARKADGPDGQPVRTRQELIEARRAREAEHKERLRERRRLAREEEERQREEALRRSASSTAVGGRTTDDGGSEDGDGGKKKGQDGRGAADDDDGALSFGRVAFSDGSRLSRDLTHVLKDPKKKGPMDPKTALLRLENRRQKAEAGQQGDGDDEVEARAGRHDDVEDKETWLAARRRAEGSGDGRRDDEAKLRRAVKRRERAKRKSEREWADRASGVEAARRDRQRRREENLRRRREDKAAGRAGRKRKAGGGKKKAAGARARPGFEGSLGVGGGGKGP